MRLRYLIILLCFLLTGSELHAQRQRLMNMTDHDDKRYYFGLTFGANVSQYRLKLEQNFVNSDSFRRITPIWSPGFNLGLMANMRLSNFIDVRLVPSLSFAEKKLKFNMSPDTTSTRSVESIYLHIPLQLKFKSNRLNNFRFYGMLGGKFDYDMSSNARSRRADEWLKVSPIDLGYEIGFGFEFYNPNFIFSPEIKLSQGLMNQLYKSPDIPLSNAINSLNARSIVISIHLEG